MKWNIDSTDDFERFLAGEMSLTDKKSFEEKLRTDKDFRNKLKFLKGLDSFLEDKDTNEFREKLNKIHDDLYNNKQSTIFMRYKKRFFQAAAVLIIFIGLGKGITIYLNYSERQEILSEAALYATNKGAEKANYVDSIMLTYNLKNYDKTIKMFSKINSDSINLRAEHYLCIASAYNKINDFENSERYFLKAKKLDPLYKEKVEWLLALSYLKSKQFKKAKKILISISKSKNHYKQEKADYVLKLFDLK